MSSLTKQEKSWALYDWANSAYSIIIVTAIFPIYFKAAADAASIPASTSTAYWGYANSIGTLLVSILAPLLGTIADFKGFKKRFFIFFFTLGVLFTFLLAVVPFNQWLILLICYIITSVGFAGANIFYDAFIVDVTNDQKMSKLSARGYAMGYIGSTIPFVIGIALTLLAQQNIIPLSVTVAMQASFIITALWWGLFTIPMLRNVQQTYYIEPVPNPIRMSFKRLFITFKRIRNYRTVFMFLLAYFFYIDGVHTIITMSTAYGKDLGFSSTTLLIVLFVTQIIAAPFSLLYAKLAAKYNEKIMILVGIFIYTFICIYAYFITSATEFWILAILVGTSQGGIQALSRSYYAKLVPKESSNEFFGFYNIFGKFAAITGPFLMGITTQLTHNSNIGVLSLVVLFIIGGFFMLRVPKAAHHAPTVTAKL